jgi:hypothetical protein
MIARHTTSSLSGESASSSGNQDRRGSRGGAQRSVQELKNPGAALTGRLRQVLPLPSGPNALAVKCVGECTRRNTITAALWGWWKSIIANQHRSSLSRLCHTTSTIFRAAPNQQAAPTRRDIQFLSLDSSSTHSREFASMKSTTTYTHQSLSSRLEMHHEQPNKPHFCIDVKRGGEHEQAPSPSDPHLETHLCTEAQPSHPRTTMHKKPHTRMAWRGETRHTERARERMGRWSVTHNSSDMLVQDDTSLPDAPRERCPQLDASSTQPLPKQHSQWQGNLHHHSAGQAAVHEESGGNMTYSSRHGPLAADHSRPPEHPAHVAWVSMGFERPHHTIHLLDPLSIRRMPPGSPWGSSDHIIQLIFSIP